MLEKNAYEDFNRAYRRGFWRKLVAWISGESNELLPYEEVRRQLPFQGQRDIGLQTIPIDKVVGSVGRYRDFDRAYLPTQRETADRWINISKARYRDVSLPPVELYKIGDVYFVKDGNHRVSVARDRNQAYIDAVVTEIDVSIPLTPDMDMDDVIQKRDYAQFMKETGLNKLRPGANLELSDPGNYQRLHEHINSHRWFISKERGYELPYSEAVTSWHDQVYQPLVAMIEAQSLTTALDSLTPADLYLWVSEFQWLRREAYQADTDLAAAEKKLLAIYNEKAARRLLQTLRRASWIDQMILAQERADFYARTQIQTLRPGATIEASLPGKYEKLLQHINVHRYYLGLERQSDVAYEEAVVSWYDNVYLPAIQMILDQDMLKEFPGRTPVDVYIWTLDHGKALEDVLSGEETTPTSGSA